MAHLDPFTPMPQNWAVTTPRPGVWVLNLQNPPENRLLRQVLIELGGHLDAIEEAWRATKGEDGKMGPGAMILTSDTPKFFCNGLDPSGLGPTSTFPRDVWDPMRFRLMTFPLVTIAAVRGHAFGGGMILALTCDYRLVSTGKGLWCMNEVLIGIPIARLSLMLMIKRMSPYWVRECSTGRRLSQKDLVDSKIVDEVVDDQGPGKDGALLARAIELGEELGPKAASGVWGCMKFNLDQDMLVPPPVLPQPPMEAKAFHDRIAREKLAAELAKL